MVYSSRLECGSSRLVTVNACAKAFLVKFCKHIVVPEVKSLTLNDDRMITQDLLYGDILNLSAADFEKFDTVIISYCSEMKRRKVNSRCRQLTDPTAFHSVQCRGSLAEIFVDLKSHTVYERLFGQDLKSIMHFCSFEKAIAVPWQTLTEGVSEIFLAMRVDENFEATHRRNVGKLSATDFQHLKSFKDVLCDKQLVKRETETLEFSGRELRSLDSD
ncbi:hypothetical protein CQW23_11957 [Capsicum baccatum]|uniref:Uncharacterized protein n=1 Tax=Capsicum baccatum TaxID=33114 RepID=A0A2G2WRD9_CAPBA|nr:hypothetical protein CQW23_11957 [Capsicum baccatum]